MGSMKGDEYSDEGISGFDKFKKAITNKLTGLDEKESYFVSKLANIFDMAVKDEENSSALNIYQMKMVIIICYFKQTLVHFS